MNLETAIAVMAARPCSLPRHTDNPSRIAPHRRDGRAGHCDASSLTAALGIPFHTESFQFLANDSRRRIRPAVVFSGSGREGYYFVPFALRCSPMRYTS